MKINRVIEWIMIIVVVLTIPLLVVMSQKEYKFIPLLLTNNPMIKQFVMSETSDYSFDVLDLNKARKQQKITGINKDTNQKDAFKSVLLSKPDSQDSIRVSIADNKITLKKLLPKLTKLELNTKFKQKLESLNLSDSTIINNKVDVIAVDEIPYYYINSVQLINQKLLEPAILSFYKSNRVDINNMITISYENENYNLQLKERRLPWSLFFNISLSLVIPLLVFLFPALKRNTDLHWYFKFIFFLLLVRMLISIFNLCSSNFLGLYVIENSILYFIVAIFIITFFSKMIKSNRFFTVSILVISLVNIWFQKPNLIWIIGLIFLFILIKSEKGINKKYYRKYMYFFLIYLFIMTMAFIPMSVINTLILVSNSSPNLSIFETKIIEVIQSIFLNGIFTYALNYSLLVFIFYRIVKINVSVVDKLPKYILIVFIPFFLFVGLVYFINVAPSIVKAITIILSLVFSFVVVFHLTKIFPILNPVRFPLNKKIIHFLNLSYDFTNSLKYSTYFVNYLKKLNKKYKVGFLTENSIIGDKFEDLNYQNATDMINLSSEPIQALNIDIELLNDTEIGKQLQYIENRDLPHLLYPIYNEKNKLQAVLAFGKFPGISWQKSLVEAIYKLVEVFSGFYLNFLTQEGYLEQEKVIVKEQEEKLYNQKIAELKTQQNEELRAEKKLITESIQYAGLIQKSLVPQPNELKKSFEEYMVIWQQKDIVGGDLYWHSTLPESNQVLFSVIDCTGHGIPGALMSVTAHSSLERIVKEHKCYEPGVILTQLHTIIGNSLHQSELNTQQDGMDMSVVKYDKENKKVYFSGANHDLIIIKGSTQELIRVRGDRYSIGGLKWKSEIEFSCHDTQLESGDSVYLFSDGVIDQPFQHSEDKLRRLGTKAWYDFLVENNQQGMDEVKASIEVLIAEMIESSPQRDDICIVGIRI